MSVVGFRFLKTKLWGMPIPFHRNFDEVNLPLYVRRRAEDGWRRGVVFIKEIVPKRMVALVARCVYNENYVYLPMKHTIELPGTVRYSWFTGKQEHWLAGEISGESVFPSQDTEESFIEEHYWGYTRRRDGGTVEYQVEHTPWRIWQMERPEFNCDVENVYGKMFVESLSKSPSSVFVAEGSPIILRRGRRLTDSRNVLDVP